MPVPGRAPRPRLGCLGRILAFLVLGAAVFAPWAFFLGGSLHPLAFWQGWGRLHSVAGADKVGTAFGLTTMIQNVGLAVFPFLNGKLRGLTSSYTASMVMFAGLGLAGLASAILLKRAEAREGGVLERSTT